VRILSVVTLVSPLGEYGGPLRVAVNQAQALAAQGHTVTLAGAARGFDGPSPSRVDGVDAELHPALTILPRTGFAGLGSPGLWRWLRRNVTRYDVVHVHAARDLVTLPAARIAAKRGVRYVVQPHGMIDESDNPLARPLDAALTRPVLRGAAHVLYLTNHEGDDLQRVADGLSLVHLINGVPEHEQADFSGPPTVLFLARLAARKRPVIFVEAARKVAPRHPGTRFVVVGPDEGEGEAVRTAIAQARAEGVDITWDGAVAPEETGAVMASASLYVLPSVDEPYGMSALEAMAAGLPVIMTDTCGLAGMVRDADAGEVTDDTLASLVDAMDRQLANPERGRAQGVNGRDYVRTHNSMTAIADQLLSLYDA
jgi:glycosyltransferase involved in cell wall biosynthesis